MNEPTLQMGLEHSKQERGKREREREKVPHHRILQDKILQ
jgi:hypothetical protein